MNVRKLLRSIRHKVERSRLYALVVWRHEARFADRALADKRVVEYDLAVLASDGRGNIGDQAMCEAVWQNVPGRILMIAGSDDAVFVPEEYRDRVSVTVVPGAISRPAGLRRDQSRSMWRAVSSARRFAVIGADVMDGVYSPGSSVMRSVVAALAARASLDSRIFAFSWSSAAVASAVVAMRMAERQGVQILPRDPRSRARLAEAGITRTLQVADLVFASSGHEEPVEISAVPADERIVLINASGLIDRTTDLHEDYIALIAWLRESGFRVVLVPHVLRRGDSDLDVLNRLAAHLAPGDILIRRQLSPTEVRGLARRACFVITGRMHLAIMSLMSHTPPFTLSTVGKVAGLYELFDLAGLEYTPTAPFSQLLIRNLGVAPDNYLIRLQNQIEESSPNVVALAKRNFRDSEDEV